MIRNTYSRVLNPIIIIVFVTVIGTLSSANAEGVFDFLDPCIGAKKDYWESRKDILVYYDKALAENPQQEATKEFSQLWWDEKLQLLRAHFDEQIAPIIESSGGDKNKAFESWVDILVGQSGGKEGINKIITKEYLRVRELKIQQQKDETVEHLENKKKKLYKECPSDVANQLFRGSVTVVTGPVNIAIANFEAAKRESGAFNQALKASTGISVDSIKKNGLKGSDNSVVSKIGKSLGLW